MNQDQHEALIDLIYDAAVDADLWPVIMERLADRIGGTGAWLSQLNMVDGGGGGLITRIDPAMPAVYAGYYALRNPLLNVANPTEYLRSWTPRILTDEDWMPKADLLASEYYNDFLKPQDIHSTVMIRLAKRGQDIAALNINRSHRQQQYGEAELAILAALHPHLIRAFRLTQAFATLQLVNHDLFEVLDRAPQALFLVDGAGRIRHANRAAEALLAGQRGLGARGGVLAAGAPQDARRLADLVAAAARSHGAVAGSMTLNAGADAKRLSIAVAPIRNAPVSPFQPEARVIVCVTDPGSGVGASQARLRALFGFTEAEARVALALFDGASPAEAAAAFGVSLNTVRTQLAHIFEKTGARRQSELMRLLTRTLSLDLD
jgi:DNA-binding CsgD family transcriptional regulator/PAS domain-containing protein